MTSLKTASLMLTSQERSALSAMLKTTLNLWGKSEDPIQRRLHGKLQSIATKLDALERSTSPSSN
jgi:hypothetical protein